MKYVNILFLLVFAFNSHAEINMDDIRSLFAKASENEEANEDLLNLTKGYSIDANPILYAYHAGALTTMANHVFWPMTKLEYFDEGKKKLQEVVKKYPGIVEIRFIRLCVQAGAPDFLDYNSDIEGDKKYLLKNINQTGWSDYHKRKVIKFLNDI